MRLTTAIFGVFMLMFPSVVQAQMIRPTETKNAALRYWMAFAEMQDAPAEKTMQDLLEKTVAGQAPWDEKSLGPILDANGAAIRMMQRATKLPECDWGLEYNQGPQASIAYAPRARVLAHLNTLQGMREMASGNTQGAINTWLAGVRFSEDIAKGGSLIFVLIANSALLPNLRALTNAGAQGYFTDTQKRQIYAQIKALPGYGFDWSGAWRMEESVGAASLEKIVNAKNPAAEYQELMGEPISNDSKIPTRADLTAYGRYMDAVTHALNLPADEANVKINGLEPERLALPLAVQRIIPNAQKENSVRSDASGVRDGLLKTVATT